MSKQSKVQNHFKKVGASIYRNHDPKISKFRRHVRMYILISLLLITINLVQNANTENSNLWAIYPIAIWGTILGLAYFKGKR